MSARTPVSRLDPHPSGAYTADMSVALRALPDDDESVGDQFVYLRGATWSDYQRLTKLRGESAKPRLTFTEGVLELMSPSSNHEWIKWMIGRLVETWCLEDGVEFSGFGSWTLKSKRKETGVEPDECYVLGEAPRKKRPDLAIEVIWTSGGIDKRDLYSKFGVPEIWFWRRGRISVHVLRGREYHQVTRSQLLPKIDLAQLASFVDRFDERPASKTIRAYKQALRTKRKG
jgi:Uma2 family endonuclease